MSTRKRPRPPSSGDVDSDDEPYLMRQKGVSGDATSENQNIDISNSMAEPPKGVSSDDPPEHAVASVAMPTISATVAAPADKQKPSSFSSSKLPFVYHIVSEDDSTDNQQTTSSLLKSPDIFYSNGPWCELLSCYSKNRNFKSSMSNFTVGSSKSADVVIQDPDIAAVACSIMLSKCDDKYVPVIENHEREGVVQVNGETIKRNAMRVLTSGDELVFGTAVQAYIFHELRWESKLTRPPDERAALKKLIEYAEHFADDWAAAHGAKFLRQLSEKKNDSASEAAADVAKEERDKMRIREDILREIVDKPNLDVSFEEFPYYLSEITKNRLTMCLVQLESKQLIKYSNENLIPRILLSGPAGSEIYQEMLAKALAHHCAARLLIIDIQAFYAAYMGPPTSEAADNSSSSTKMKTINTSFKLGDIVKYIGGNTRGPSPGMRGRVLLQFEGNSVSKVGVRFDKAVKDGINLGGRCDHGHGFFCNADDLCLESSGSLEFHSLLINTIFETVCDKSQESPFILLIKDAEKSVTENPETYKVFKGHLDKLPVNAVVIGSQTHSDDQNEKSEMQSNKTNKKVKF